MATTESEPLRIAEIPTGVKIDPVTLDIIEGALKNARFEMDAVLFRSAMSPVIREQHDEFPMLTDPRGRMVVGQFGAYINEMMAEWDRGVYPGDVILTSDPFKCSASISHTNDWLVLLHLAPLDDFDRGDDQALLEDRAGAGRQRARERAARVHLVAELAGPAD